MGCLLAKGILKHDEVCPVSIRPLPTATNGQTLRPDPHPQLPQQVVLTNDSAAPSSTNQNGSVSLTNQEHVSSPSDTVSRTSESEKGGHSCAEAATCVSNEDAAGSTSEDAANSSSHDSRATGQTNDSRATNDNRATDSRATGQTNDSRATGQTNDNCATNDNRATDNRATGQTNDSRATTSSCQDDAALSTNQNPESAESVFRMPDVVVEQVPDGEGCPITLGMLLGTWTAPWPWLPEQILRAQLFSFHDSDVILVGYAKSGTHWLWEMLHMVMTGRPEHCRTPKERLMLSFSTQEFFDSLPPPRVFNTHAPFSGLPAAIRDGSNKCKMIYLLRNPKDVAVSYYHHLINQVDFQYEGTFHGYLDLFLEGKVPGGSWCDYVLGWENTLRENPHLPVLVLHYEDVKEDTVAALQKVGQFLGVDCDGHLLDQVAEQCTIARMKAVDEELKEQGPQHVNLSKTGKNFIYRKGEVGDWQNWFTEEDERRFMEVIDDKLRHSHLRFRYLLGGKEEGGAGGTDSTRL